MKEKTEKEVQNSIIAKSLFFVENNKMDRFLDHKNES